MDSFPAAAQYFMGTISATVSGIVYWLAIENLQPIREPRKFEKLWLAALLSVLISPLGAWIVSGFLRMRSTAQDLKKSDK